MAVAKRSPGFAGLPGRGPWLISVYCSANSHNTLTAARRGGQRGGCCTCPRALALLHMWRLAGNAGHQVDIAEPRQRGPKMHRPLHAKPISVARLPDFGQGLCTMPDGEQAATGGLDEGSSERAIRKRATAVAQCERCPIRLSVCRPWVLTQENPAGSWGGVWGGLDVWNRMGKQLVWNVRENRAEVIDYEIN